MSAVPQREALGTEEQREFPMRGPFGGVQSELPRNQIEDFGFLDSPNILFRNGTAEVRPGFTPLSVLPAPSTTEPIVGVADFYNVSGVRVQVLITPTKVWKWESATESWTEITGAGLTGPVDRPFAWTVVNNLLCFSQGVDKVQVYDGITSTYAAADANAVPARYMMELGTHLVVADTIEAATRFPQRIRWTGSGDVTDWTSFNAGVRDELNDLGPATGLVKLYQLGYMLQQWGITQVIPTGIGTRPFDFVPLSSRSRGNVAPYSLASQGNEFACYVGKDNIYRFNGSESEPFGDAPIDGRRRLGARKRIFADLAVSNIQNVFGFTTTSINGRPFNAYWLAIPNVAVWVYNFDEGNWTPFTYDKRIVTMGLFYKAGVPRIIDLVGTISDQNWSADSLVPTNPFDSLLLGFSDGTPGFVDFTNYSEKAWGITSGQHEFNDPRHDKVVKRFRLIVCDLGQVSFQLTVSGKTTRNGVVSTKTLTRTVTLGNGSGEVISQVLSFDIPGKWITWSVASPAEGPSAQPACFIEFAPIYDIAGEERRNA